MRLIKKSLDENFPSLGFFLYEGFLKGESKKTEIFFTCNFQ